MINVTKISNQDDGFLLSYYNDNQNQSIVVNGDNIVAELNSAFATIKKTNDEYKTKMQEREQFYMAQDTLNSPNIGSGIGLGELRMATQKSLD